MTEPASLASGRVALLVEEDFEDRELPLLIELLRAEGLAVTVIGPVADTDYQGKRREATVRSEMAAAKARIKDFDIVVVPGGKPVASIDRGVQLLITINALRGRVATCWPSVAIDVKNAGGRYVDRPVVEDGPVITARKWDDVAALTDVIVKVLRS